MVDLKNSCECIPGYQERKGLHTGTVEIDIHEFCHLKQIAIYVKNMNLRFVKNTYF